MKKIEAIIKPFKLEEVKDALSALGRGHDRQRGQGFGRRRAHRNLPGNEYTVDFLPKIKLEIVLADSAVPAAVKPS